MIISRAMALKTFARRISTVNKKAIGVIGVPFGKGQKEEGAKLRGLELAPDAIRETSLFRNLRSAGIDVKDYGNITYSPSSSNDSSEAMSLMNNYHDVVPNTEKVSEAVSSVLSSGRIPLTLGGDHSLAAGTIHGHLKVTGEDNVAVIYVDAHADINIPTTSHTGNVHGMSVAMAANELQTAWSSCSGLEWLKHRLPLRSLGYIGLRCVDAPEIAIIKENNIAAYYMSDVIRFGIAGVLEQLLSRIDPEGRKSIHLSIDTDALDPCEAPSTTFPVRGGLLLRELKFLAEEINKTGRLRAVDWVEVNPLLGSDKDREKTLEAVKDGLLSCFGVNIS